MYIIHVHIHSRRLRYPNEVSGQKDLLNDGVWLAHCGIRRAQILQGCRRRPHRIWIYRSWVPISLSKSATGHL